MRIAMFGGSFDPVHQAHLILAEQCREQAQLDEVIFMPTSTSPLKQEGAMATDRQRLQMLHLATGGHSNFSVSDLEIQRGGISYTVETLTELKNQYPDAELFFMLGADSVASFDQWREPAQILQLATALVVQRPGSEPADLGQLHQIGETEDCAIHVDCPLIDISSTAIRAKIAESKTVRFLLPRAVEKYVETQKMYRTV